MQKILFLEDDDILAESLIELLEVEKFSITHVKNGEDVLEQTFNEHFDIYLFDVNVPKINGFELLKQLRASGDKTPTVFLTAMSDIASLAEGFDVGADDYIKKPFDFDELLIRLHAIIKKQYRSHFDKIKIANFEFNIQKNELYKDGDFIQLPPYELTLVKLFFKNIDRTLTKDYLFEELSYDDREASDGALRVHINKLRKVNLPILTVKGIGYRLGKS